MTRIRARRKKRTPFQFVATCGAGLESLVQEEIRSFGGKEPVTTPGAVSWQAVSLESAYRACLWSRFASRILVELSSFEARDPEDLYREAAKIDWSKHFSGDATFAVSCTLVKAELTHSHYASLKTKDAIVDQFRKRTGQRPDVDVRQPGIRINLHVDGTAATLALDLSGESLHRRGYRASAGTAPLKESLAAAIAHLSGVRKNMDSDCCLLDPMCGSGTLLIEAAMIVGDSAPGLLRKKFGFIYWHHHNQKMWDGLVNEALAREDQLTEESWPIIIGYDADPGVVAGARKNILNAGLADRITVKQRQLARLQPPAAKGYMFTNPPYGERLSEKEAVKYLYRCLGRIFRAGFSGWQLGFFTSHPDLADMLRVSWQERYRLYNGPIKCRLLVTSGVEAQSPQPPHQWELAETNPELPAEDFSNRLRKNCQTLLPWAREKNITCFRVYDADLPDFNIAIDLYEQWIHVSEYAPSATVDAERARERFSQALAVIRHILSIPHSMLFIKSRQKQRDKKQYQKRAAADETMGKLYEVHEGECRFLVNFTDHVDTGLFLDHRKTRVMLGRIAQGRTFLNLFGYTGSATVHAAMGGATSTTTVDLSEKSLIRAQANLSLSGHGGPLHRFEVADCMTWLKKSRDRFGVIYVDPPTFANGRHKNLDFDVQQDHPELLRIALRHLSRDGILIFSTNTRTFTLDPELEEEFMIEEISRETIPEDFVRNSRIHRCWWIQ